MPVEEEGRIENIAAAARRASASSVRDHLRDIDLNARIQPQNGHFAGSARRTLIDLARPTGEKHKKLGRVHSDTLAER